MKKISIIYWSSGGNVEVIANTILEELKSAGADVKIKSVGDAEISDVTEADAVAFGSPSMDNNRIEQYEMEPFINEFKLLPNNNKKIILFGSYGWDDGKFMDDWVKRMNNYGFNVLGQLAVKESPSDSDLIVARNLARKLIE
ncbi:flavodoxin [Clostridium tarantellae]|uniref:Flavodoxin n=1 Tax=Clostridium tarantellae TaxID=39493 RepID=A0A6I1MPX1_9CLOT|nr:flavodoxin [Clostridium tarantellae]MPQ42339.1 flavodoxin [Clostridium tarantellae]